MGHFSHTDDLMAAELVTDGQFSELLEQVTNHVQDKDRLRILKNVLRAEQYLFTVDHVAQIVGEISFGDPKVEAAVLLHARLADPSSDYSTVLDCFKYKEDKDDNPLQDQPVNNNTLHT